MSAATQSQHANCHQRAENRILDGGDRPSVISSTSPLSPKHLLCVSLCMLDGGCYWAKCQFGVVCSSLTMLLCAWPSPHTESAVAVGASKRRRSMVGEAVVCGRASSVCVGVLYQTGIPINRVESKGNNPGDAVCVELSGEQRSRQRPMAMSRQPAQLSVLVLVSALLLW